jgi:hypothetical protein
VGEFANIYLLNVDEAIQGSAQRMQLTDTDAHDGFPRWSPDGSQLAFISNRVGEDNWEIFLMNADGNNQRRLTYSDELDGIPTWSPDGTQIAFESSRDGDNEIYVLNVDEALEDSEGALIVQLTDNDASDMHPTWRPAPATFEPDTSIEVPNVPAPIIDGSFSEGEWEGAMMIDLTNGGEMMVMHDGGYLYLGIRSRDMGFGSICTLDENRVSILHSSAGLGTAIFERDGADWLRVQQFSYCCWASTRSQLDDFLQEEGWVASVGTKGAPDEMEYQIAMPDGALTLAVVYVDDFTFETALHWPLDLEDDCHGLALIPEDPPERLMFSPDTWVTILASSD